MRIGVGACALFAIAVAFLSIAVAEEKPKEREGVTELNERQCGRRDEAIHARCRTLTYKGLPEGVKWIMRKLHCNARPGKNYDYGYAVDLNEDGSDEYAFCCNEVAHGPCDMRVFGKVGKNWKEILDRIPGYADGISPCFGFLVLPGRTNGYHDMCVEGYVLRFSRGEYRIGE